MGDLAIRRAACASGVAGVESRIGVRNLPRFEIDVLPQADGAVDVAGAVLLALGDLFDVNARIDLRAGDDQPDRRFPDRPCLEDIEVVLRRGYRAGLTEGIPCLDLRRRHLRAFRPRRSLGR